MADSTEGREFDLKDVMKQVEADTNGPSHRAARVYNHLSKSEFTNWDVLCFAVEYIASMTGVLSWLAEPARHLVRLLYIAHYIRFESTSWLDTKRLETNSLGPDTPSTSTKTEP